MGEGIESRGRVLVPEEVEQLVAEIRALRQRYIDAGAAYNPTNDAFEHLYQTLKHYQALVDDFVRVYANLDHRSHDDVEVSLFSLWVRAAGPAIRKQVEDAESDGLPYRGE